MRFTKTMVTIAVLLALLFTAGCTNTGAPAGTDSSGAGTGSSSSVSSNVSSSAGSSTSGSDTSQTSSSGSSNSMVEIQRGRVDGQVYTSDFSGLTFTAPAKWVYSSDEDIATMMGLGTALMKDEGLSFSEEALKMTSLYDMVSTDPTTGNNVIVMYENLGAYPLGTIIDADVYLMSVKQQLGSISMYTVEDSYGEVTLGGEAYKTLNCSFEANGVKGLQTYAVRKSGDFIIGVIVSAFGSSQLADILANFS